MPLIPQESVQAREFFTGHFGPRFPFSFQALQRMAMAASKAYKNAGKKSWLGRDKGAESYADFVKSVQILGSYLTTEGFLEAVGGDEWEATRTLVRSFFVAYPNWPDAMCCWEWIEHRTAQR